MMNDLFEFFKREPKLWPSEGIVCIFKILIDDLIDLCVLKWVKLLNYTILINLKMTIFSLKCSGKSIS